MSAKINIPASTAAVTVRLINPVHFGPAIVSHFLAPPIDRVEALADLQPSFSFLIEHPSGRKLVFDLGFRKDFENYSPAIRDQLLRGGVKGADVEAVIWSHGHWDHIGDPSTFPPTTDLVVGPGFKAALLPGAPANPASPILESDYTGRNLREISFTADAPSIGQFPAYDYFRDGSFYLLDTPGHAAGHMCGLARTTIEPETFVLLGGDAAYYTGVLRPSPYSQIPDTLAPHMCLPDVALPSNIGDAFAALQKERGRETTDPLFELTFGEDVPEAIRTVKKLQELDGDERIFVIISHDVTVRDSVKHFPDNLNKWKTEGWNDKTRWGFLRDVGPYWATQDRDSNP
ncbi:Metallo-hydrolase/oxidoreductase [Byssothecium circinans]|uniref:Metallo-hydrolase/oxidoreductase n=1 Tax=Byssothecium circinans TaxID=147558 RepID=A0A6A5TJT0_9PLEO|nr:Metallo-hydrolase/oxidoreductase [Byssothecium circinans]